MFRLSRLYSEFSHIVCDDKIYEDESIDFIDICNALRVAPARMDELLLSELGIGGEQLLEKYRTRP